MTLYIEFLKHSNLDRLEFKGLSLTSIKSSSIYSNLDRLEFKAQRQISFHFQDGHSNLDRLEFKAAIHSLNK